MRRRCANSTAETVEQKLRRNRAEGLGGLSHDRQERIDPRDVVDVVEADEREIAWNVELAGAGGFDDADDRDVVHREDRRRRVGEIEELKRRLAGDARGRSRSSLTTSASSNGEAARGERLPVSLETVACGRDLERPP